MKPGWHSELLENSCMSYRFRCVLLGNKKPCYPNGQHRGAAFAVRGAKIKKWGESSSLLRGWALQGFLEDSGHLCSPMGKRTHVTMNVDLKLL